MGVVKAGDVRQVTINGREFDSKGGDGKITIDLGGFTNKVEPTGNGSLDTDGRLPVKHPASATSSITNRVRDASGTARRRIPTNLGERRVVRSWARRIAARNDEPPWPGRWPWGLVLELSGGPASRGGRKTSASRGTVRNDEAGTGSTGETSFSERSLASPSTGSSVV